MSRRSTQQQQRQSKDLPAAQQLWRPPQWKGISRCRHRILLPPCPARTTVRQPHSWQQCFCRMSSQPPPLRHYQSPQSWPLPSFGVKRCPHRQRSLPQPNSRTSEQLAGVSLVNSGTDSVLLLTSLELLLWGFFM